MSKCKIILYSRTEYKSFSLKTMKTLKNQQKLFRFYSHLWEQHWHLKEQKYQRDQIKLGYIKINLFSSQTLIILDFRNFSKSGKNKKIFPGKSVSSFKNMWLESVSKFARFVLKRLPSLINLKALHFSVLKKRWGRNRDATLHYFALSHRLLQIKHGPVSQYQNPCSLP